MYDITVYSTPTCHYCSKVKEFIESKGKKYKTVDVSADPEALKTLLELTEGRRTVPVTTNGSKVVIGFNEAELEDLVSSEVVE